MQQEPLLYGSVDIWRLMDTRVITICRISNARSCWAHVRRYFTDAIPKGKEYDYSLPAVQGVQFCSKLFDCERYSKAKNHTAEQRKQFRLEKEKPILEAFWNRLDQQRQQGNPLA